MIEDSKAISYICSMYQVPYYKEKDPALIDQFMHDHPFIFLCGVSDAGIPVGTHLPVLISRRSGELHLRGHMMKNTDHHKAFLKNPDALAVFSGPHTYVSASWYSNPLQGSTWNYMVVHARGRLEFLDHDGLLSVLKETTFHFENDRDSPALFEKLPDEYVSRMAKAIVGFEIRVLDCDHVFKLSQNRDEESFKNIIGQLEQRDDSAKSIAAEMKKRR